MIKSPAEDSEGKYFKDRYDFTCPVCSTEQHAEPSIFMTKFGINQGAGRCLGCDELLLLKINDENAAMIADKYPISVENLKVRKGDL